MKLCNILQVLPNISDGYILDLASLCRSLMWVANPQEEITLEFDIYPLAIGQWGSGHLSKAVYWHAWYTSKILRLSLWTYLREKDAPNSQQ